MVVALAAVVIPVTLVGYFDLLLSAVPNAAVPVILEEQHSEKAKGFVCINKG